MRRKKLLRQRDRLGAVVFHRVKELLSVQYHLDAFSDVSLQGVLIELANKASISFSKRRKEECAGFLDKLYSRMLNLSLGLESLEPPTGAQDWGPLLRVVLCGRALSRQMNESMRFNYSRVLECLCELTNWWMTSAVSPVAGLTAARKWLYILSWISQIVDTLLQEVRAHGCCVLEKCFNNIFTLRSIQSRADLDDLIFGHGIQSWRRCALKSHFSSHPRFPGDHVVGEEVWDLLSLLDWELGEYGRCFLNAFERLLPLSNTEWCEWKRVLKTVAQTKITKDSARAVTKFLTSVVFERLAKMGAQVHGDGVTISDSSRRNNSFRDYMAKITFELWIIATTGWKALDIGGSDGETRLEVLSSLIVFYGSQDVRSVLLRLLEAEEVTRASWCTSFLDIGRLLVDYRSPLPVFRTVMNELRMEANTADDWLMASCRCISDDTFGRVVTLSLEDVVEEVLRERQFDQNARTPEDLKDALHSLSSCKHQPSKLAEIGSTWVRTGMPYDKLFKESEARDMSTFVPFQSDEERHLSELKSKVHSCQELTKKPIGEWTQSNIEEWSMLARSMLNHNQSAFLESVSSRLALRAEIAAVAIRAAILFHSRKSLSNVKHDWDLRTTQLVALSLFFICPCGKTRSKLCQIPTGEGKSWILAILGACLAFSGRTVDIVMPSKELAQRDAAHFSEYFSSMKIRSDCCCVNTSPVYAAIYAADVVYGDELNFNGDWLRSQFFRANTRGRRKFDVCLLDEVDNLLVDKVSHSVQITGREAGISPLNLVLAAIWKNLVSCFDHIVEDPKGSGVYYSVPVDFARDKFDDRIIRTKDPSSPYEQCRVLIPGGEQGVRKRLTEMSESFARDIITPLSPDEVTKRELYHSISESLKGHLAALEKLNDKHSSPSDVQDVSAERKRLEEIIEESIKKLSELEPEVHSEPIVLPDHLLLIAKRNIPSWCDSALQALVDKKNGVHYTVLDGEVKIVDYRDTGSIYENMVWDGGLHQFLQLKEGVPLTPLSPTKCFLSSAGFFKMYQNVFGMTGTLGDDMTRAFLSEQYSADLLVLPAFARVEVKPDRAPWAGLAIPVRYAAKELTPIVVDSAHKHAKRILSSCTQIARCGRAVLLLVSHIQDVHTFTTALRSLNSFLRVYPYTGEEAFNHRELHEGEIVVATNIAGRGEDFIPDDKVEQNGGLHVCITFFPESLRVELQNAGRTCRQGRRGTVQMILCSPGSTTVVELIKQRDETERDMSERARARVNSVQLRDHLLRNFCALINEVLGDTGDPHGKLDYLSAVRQARELWDQWFTDEMKPSNPRYVGAYRLWRGRRLIASLDHKREGEDEDEDSDTETLFSAIQKSLDPLYTPNTSEGCENDATENNDEEEFHADYTEELKQRFLSMARVRFPDDVLEEVFKPEEVGTEELALCAFDTKEEELESLKDAWGHWLAHQSFRQGTSKAKVDQVFNSFANDVRRMAAAGRIITNPHYYILKGTRFLRQGKDGAAAALAAFDAAIGLDPKHVSFIVHFYRAVAILANDGTKYVEAVESLKAAKKCILEEDVMRLYVFLGLCSGAGKECLVTSIISQINLFEVLCSLIENQITQLQDNKDKEKFCVDSRKTLYLSSVLKEENFPLDVVQAAESLRCDGLTYLFQIKKDKIPWILIGGLVCAGLVFGGIGAACVYYGGMTSVFAPALISAGVGDILDGLSRIWTHDCKFDLQRYCIRKAVSIAVGVVFHWKSVCSGVKKALSNIGSSTFNSAMKAKAKAELWEQLCKAFKIGLLKQGSTLIAFTEIERIFKESVSHCRQAVGLSSSDGAPMNITITDTTQKFVSSNPDFSMCVDADVKEQTVRFELALRKSATHTLERQLSAKHQNFTTCFQCSYQKEAIWETVANEFCDSLLSEAGGEWAFLAKDFLLGFLSQLPCYLQDMRSSFYNRYGDAIKPIGKDAREVLGSVEGTARDPRESVPGRGSEEATSTNAQSEVHDAKILETLCENMVDPHRTALDLPSSASGFDSEKKEEIDMLNVKQGPHRKDDITKRMCEFFETIIAEDTATSSTDLLYSEMRPVISEKLSRIATDHLCENMVKEAQKMMRKHYQDMPVRGEDNRIPRAKKRRSLQRFKSKTEEVNGNTANDIRAGKEAGLVGIAFASTKFGVQIEVYNDENQLIAVFGECYPNDIIQLKFVNQSHYECINDGDYELVGDDWQDEADHLFLSILRSVPEERYHNELCGDLRELLADEVENGGFYYSALVFRGEDLQPYRYNPLLYGWS